MGMAVWMVMKGSSVREVSCAATEAARKTAHAIGRTTNMVNEWDAVYAWLKKCSVITFRASGRRQI